MNVNTSTPTLKAQDTRSPSNLPPSSPHFAEDEITPVASRDGGSSGDRVEGMTLKTVNDVQPASATVTTQQPQAIPPMIPENYVVKPEFLGEAPDFVDCPYCKGRHKTKVSQQASSKTNLAALICCLCCGVITVFIPICCHWCADIEHHCENCNRMVARQPHEGKMEAVLPVETNSAGRNPKYGESKFATMPDSTRKNMEVEAAT